MHWYDNICLIKLMGERLLTLKTVKQYSKTNFSFLKLISASLSIKVVEVNCPRYLAKLGPKNDTKQKKAMPKG